MLLCVTARLIAPHCLEPTKDGYRASSNTGGPEKQPKKCSELNILWIAYNYQWIGTEYSIVIFIEIRCQDIINTWKTCVDGALDVAQPFIT